MAMDRPNNSGNTQATFPLQGRRPNARESVIHSPARGRIHTPGTKARRHEGTKITYCGVALRQARLAHNQKVAGSSPASASSPGSHVATKPRSHVGEEKNNNPRTAIAPGGCDTHRGAHARTDAEKPAPEARRSGMTAATWNEIAPQGAPTYCFRLTDGIRATEWHYS